MVMEYGVKSPSLNKGAGDVATWALSQQMLTPDVCAHQQSEGFPCSLSTSNPGFSPARSRKKCPNPPTRGTKSTEKSGGAISRPKLTHQWYEDHRKEQEDHFGTRDAMILARSQKGNGHGVRRQIAVSKQRSREYRD